MMKIAFSRLLCLLVLGSALSSCSLFQGGDCDCPTFGQLEEQQPAEELVLSSDAN